jgi:hypothetical protein
LIGALLTQLAVPAIDQCRLLQVPTAELAKQSLHAIRMATTAHWYLIVHSVGNRIDLRNIALQLGHCDSASIGLAQSVL